MPRHGTREWLVGQSRDLHLPAMAAGVFLSLMTRKTELVVREVYGAGNCPACSLLCSSWPLRLLCLSREHHHVTLVTTPQSGMRGLSWPPQACTLPSSVTGIAHLPRQLTMQNCPSVMRPSKNLPSR